MTARTVIVVTVGGSREPIIKSLTDHRPDLIYFLPSSESKSEIPEILSAVYPDGSSPPIEIFVIGNPNDLLSCFRTCQQAFDRIESQRLDDDCVIVDPTGGTKLMSASIVLAAANVGAEVVYVAGERGKGGLGVVESGTEQVRHSVHPYDFLSVSAKRRFCVEFNSYRFESALDTARDTAHKSGRVLQPLFTGLAKISEGYLFWDRFQHHTAKQRLNSGLNYFGRLTGDLSSLTSAMGEFLNAVRSNVVALDGVIASKQTPDSLSFDLVDDLVANSYRRHEEGKYDDAVARLYRSLEMIAQVRIYQHFKCSTTRFPLSLLSSEVRQAVFPRSSEDGTRDLGLRHSFEVLAEIGDEYGKKYRNSETELRALLGQRNSSVLAHGQNPLKKEQYQSLYQLFKETFGFAGKVTFPKLDFETIEPLGWE